MKTLCTLCICVFALSLTSAIAQASKWTGKYMRSETQGKTAGGTSIMYSYSLEISQKEGKLIAHYHVDGYQTLTRHFCLVKEISENKIQLIFEKFGKQDLFKSSHLFKKGQKLMTLTKKGYRWWVTYDKAYPHDGLKGERFSFSKE